ncbi:MAG: glucosidase [Bacteroidia bacterium]
MTPEHIRLSSTEKENSQWKKWGPYLTERQWGTVREDYSHSGSAWESVSHDMARSKAYRWGEEGIGGISDDKQLLCFSIALWNQHDPILKERIFGLTGNEGNHAEDAKEHYYYLDSTPTHSYMKMLYKYPQHEFPYKQLIDENRSRGKSEDEFELIDTGIFNEDKYFDVFIEYAKNDTDDLLIQLTINNRGNEDALLNVLPTLWFRNTWAWGYDNYKPVLSSSKAGEVNIQHRDLGDFTFYCDKKAELIFCDNETNVHRLYNANNQTAFCKDGINNYIVHKKADAINHEKTGTKASANYLINVKAHSSEVIQLRLVKDKAASPFKNFDSLFAARKKEADKFYEEIQKDVTDADARLVQRQAFAGMLWSKQFFYFDIPQWLKGDPSQPAPPKQRRKGRNHDWIHLNNADIISMPDKWEYPWYAAWDLAFHCVTFAMIDADFAKSQLILLTREWYMHPNGQLPAYEWAFGDVNPPVHAWATLRVYQMEKEATGKGDTEFLEHIFHKLLLNFTWWVNRKDKDGLNIFQGGFLGLDNIGVFDRSSDLPTGGYIEQADGTSWMAMYSLNLMRMSLELARTNSVYENMATKFFEHFLLIAGAMTNLGDEGIDLWDNEDEFFYDVLHTPEHQRIKLKVRSIVGLIPLFAVEVLDDELLKAVPDFMNRLNWYLQYKPELTQLVSRWKEKGMNESQLMALLRGHRMKSLLSKMLDETEFLSDYGIRALSKAHKEHPYIFNANGKEFKVTYTPGESDSGLFGGNSNWRGPIWMPINYLLIESLTKFHSYYGDDFKVEYPSNSGNMLSLKEVAIEVSKRLTNIFMKDKNGKRAVYNYNDKIQSDPHFNEYILFHEYFHGDNGRGVGASHQTGWTGLIANLISFIAKEEKSGTKKVKPMEAMMMN